MRRVFYLFTILTTFFISIHSYSLNINEDPSLKRIVLDNGLVVILKQKKDIPMIAMQMWVKAGSITETKNMGAGLSHYFEHMLGKRTKKRSTEGFYNDIRKMGGSDANAYTTYDRTVYHFTIHKEYLENGIEALSDMMMNTVLDDQESTKEIMVILKEINMGEDSPSRNLWQLFSQTAFTEHPYRYPVIGYRELFTSLTKQDMLDYYHTMYSPNNMFLVMVGDFDVEKGEEFVRKYFKDFKRKKVPPIFIPDEPEQTTTRKVTKRFGIKTSKVILGYKTVNALSKDVAPLDVIAVALGQGKTSRLYQNLKYKNRLVNEVSSGSWTPKHQGLFEISMDLDEKNIDKASELILAELENIKEKGITDEELKKAKQNIQVESIQQMQTLGGFARSLAYGEFLGDLHYDRQYLEAISQVKNEDVQRVAKKYFKKNKLTMAVLLPEKKKDQVTVAKTEKAKKTGDIERIVLKNGLTVLIKEDHSLPLVGIHAKFTAGYRYENKDNQGLYNLLSRMLFRGTTTKDFNQIAEVIEKSGGYLYSNSGENSISINGNFLSQNFKSGFDLFLDVISSSTFPTDEVAKAKKDIFAQIKRRDDDIWSASRYHLRRIRYKDHSYSFDGIGTTETINNLTRKDLFKAYRQVICPQNAILAIFGDVNKEEIIARLEKKSTFNCRKAEPLDVKEVKAIQTVTKDIFYKDEKRQQAIIKILFDAANYYSEDKYPLYLLTHVFSGIGGRLFLDLRSKRTLAYSTGGVFQPKMDKGLFVFYIGTEPGKSQEAIKGIFEHIEKVKTELITEKELEIAKNSAIGGLIKQLQTLNGQANVAVSFDKLGLGFNYHKELISNLKKVSREDIQRVAKKYFDTDKYVLSIVQSKPKD